ncbi:hypothetical protein NIES2100_47370 [Calothrix sp. NIES-2100]|uniref:nuclear transport factor 2 family protein n=1 Tax=Calothrix sp. NIES-2100 TaxID=1954172 RepID=UPI000B622B02|nr:hypothetical protein NIES2100_47370 [Calothrix sp. NIES-2100]
MSHGTNITPGNPGDKTHLITDYNIVPQNSDERKTWYASSDLYTNLASTRETGGTFNAFDFFLPVGGGPPLHYHTWENEAWYGIQGNLTFGLGNKASTNPQSPFPSEPKYTLAGVPAGMLIYGPKLLSHVYGNKDSTDAVVGANKGARTFSITAPGGLEQFFTYVSETVPPGDRNNPLPTPLPPPPEQFKRLVEIGIRVGGAPYFVLPLPDYKPPADSLDYVAVLPKNPDQDLVNRVVELKNQAQANGELDQFKIWQIGGDGDDDKIPFPVRPTFQGDFGIQYTSLLTPEETGGDLKYNEFTLNPQGNASNFPTQIESDKQQVFYVKEGELSLKIGDEVKVAKKDEFVYIAPDNKYSIANVGSTPVDALAVTILKEPPPPVPTPSPLTPQGAVSSNHIAFLGGDNQIFDQPNESRNRIYGTKGNDEIYLTKDDRAFGKDGDDLLDASSGDGGNRIYGGKGNDEIYVNKSDRAFGEDGNDILDASRGEGGNRLDGGKGNDDLIAGSNDELHGGLDDDRLFISEGGNNVLYGNAGKDQFWIVNGSIPATVPEDRQNNYQLQPPFAQVIQGGLPKLEDTRNTIADFEIGVDKIGISGLDISFDDLRLLPAFGDLQSTSIIATMGDKEISLANVKGVIFDELSASDFVFEDGGDNGGGSNNNYQTFTPTDELAIMKLMAKYDIALDEQDIPTAVAAYADDAILANLDGQVQGKAAIQQVHEFLLAPYDPVTQPNRREPGRRHVTSNIVIEPTSATTATARSYLMVFSSKTDLEFVALAVQEDKWVKVNGEWKIQERKIIDDAGFRDSNLRGATGYVENITTDKDDLILGTTGDDTFSGKEGNDRMFGLAGNDKLSGDNGNDFLQGDQGNDSLTGGDGRDVLNGGLGVDYLTGGGDTITGLDDADIFIVKSFNDLNTDNHDVIQDFQVGTDVLGLVDGIQFGSLTISQNAANTEIRLTSNNELLSVLTGITATSITQNSFIDYVG